MARSCVIMPGMDSKNAILLGVAGLILTIVIAVAAGVWAIGGLRAEIAELRGALYVHIGSHQHGVADAGGEDNKAE